MNMEVQSEFLEAAMAGNSRLSTPENNVNTLLHEIVMTMAWRFPLVFLKQLFTSQRVMQNQLFQKMIYAPD